MSRGGFNTFLSQESKIYKIINIKTHKPPFVITRKGFVFVLTNGCRRVLVFIILYNFDSWSRKRLKPPPKHPGFCVCFEHWSPIFLCISYNFLLSVELPMQIRSSPQIEVFFDEVKFEGKMGIVRAAGAPPSTWYYYKIVFLFSSSFRSVHLIAKPKTEIFPSTFGSGGASRDHVSWR